MALKYEPPTSFAAAEGAASVQMGKVVDSRGTPSNWLGAIRGGYGNPLKKLYTEGPTAEVVALAFEDALSSRQLLAPNAMADYRLDVLLLKFDTSYYFNKEAHVNFELSLLHKPSGDTVFERSFVTANETGGAGAGIFGDVEALANFANQTLNETIDKALSDPDLIDIVIGTAHMTRPSSAASRLEELQLLKDNGLITAEEYERKRQLVIESL